MFNVVFYDDNLTEDAAPKKTGEYYLSTLKDGSSFFKGLTEITKVDDDLSSLVNGTEMFYNCTSLNTVDSKTGSLVNGSYMFYGCTALNTVTIDAGSLTDGEGMFWGCSNLTSNNYDLSKLVNGTGMYRSCKSLSQNTYNLSSLKTGAYMFGYCTGINSFKSNLSSLTNGSNMFYACTNLTSFTSDLSSLTNGSYMFYGCSNLNSFTSDLSSLTNGGNMFFRCKLDAQSVMYILASLPTGRNTSITIGIDVSSSVVDGKDTATQLLEFANEVGYDTWADLKQAYKNKKWTVTWQYGGTTTSITLSEDEQFRGVPVYARLIEVLPQGEEYTEEEKEMAEYCTEDGTKYYNIEWGHDVTHPEDFEYFGSLLEACGYYGVIPKIYLEEV